MSDTELTISYDRQIRSYMIAYNRSIKYDSKKPILSKITKNVFDNTLNEFVTKTNVKKGNYYIQFNSVGWARSMYLHLKMVIDPEECLNKKLYPKWVKMHEKNILKEYEKRYNYKLKNSIYNILKLIKNDNEPKHLPSGEIHGLYYNMFVDIKDLYEKVLALENYMYSIKTKGNYSIIILPSNGGYAIMSIINEDLFEELYPETDIIDTYEDKNVKRRYYKSYKKLKNEDYIFKS